MAKNKVKEFETLEECETFQNANDASICRIVPRLETWEKEDERREQAKKGKKRRGPR